MNVSWHLYIAIIYTDPKLVDQLLSPSLLRFLKTGADHYALSFDDDLDNVLFIIKLTQFLFMIRSVEVSMD